MLLEPDSDGWYELEDLQLTEEAATGLTLELEGSQHVERGVYIYTSEIRDGVPSQTFVGIAEGTRAVAVSMETSLRFAVEESVMTVRTVWNDSGRMPPHAGPENPDMPDMPTAPEIPVNPDPSTSPEQEPAEDPREEIPKEEEDTVPEQVTEKPPAEKCPAEEPPLPQEVPKTGDAAGLWFRLLGVSGAGLGCILLLERRKKSVK